jgi:Flp pilus assembly protein TadG
VVAGGIDLARVFYASVTLANAAEVGALYGSRGVSASSDTGGIQTAATNAGKDLTMTATATRYCSCGSGPAQSCPASCSEGNASHTYVKVETTYTFNPFFPVPGIPSSVPISRTAVMRVQTQ